MVLWARTLNFCTRMTLTPSNHPEAMSLSAIGGYQIGPTALDPSLSSGYKGHGGAGDTLPAENLLHQTPVLESQTAGMTMPPAEGTPRPQVDTTIYTPLRSAGSHPNSHFLRRGPS
jgi:hypothetical protein